MKKILLCMSVLLIGTLSSCSIISAPVDAVVGEAGLVVTNLNDKGQADGSAVYGEFEVAAGQKAIRNVAVVLNAGPSEKITLTKAPDNAQCAILNNGAQIYCRLGDFTPYTNVTGKFSGRVVTTKLGYINAAGETKTLDGTVLHKP